MDPIKKKQRKKKLKIVTLKMNSFLLFPLVNNTYWAKQQTDILFGCLTHNTKITDTKGMDDFHKSYNSSFHMGQTWKQNKCNKSKGIG